MASDVLTMVNNLTEAMIADQEEHLATMRRMLLAEKALIIIAELIVRPFPPSMKERMILETLAEYQKNLHSEADNG